LKEAPKVFTMYDAVTVSNIPPTPQAVAGYVDGKFPTYATIRARFPRAKHLSIAVFPSDNADCLDIEVGDARPDQAGAWVKRQKALGIKLIVLYFSVSNKPAVEASLRANGIARSSVKLWGAHYTGIPHIEPGYDAIKYTDHALGRSLDASL